MLGRKSRTIVVHAIQQVLAPLGIKMALKESRELGLFLASSAKNAMALAVYTRPIHKESEWSLIGLLNYADSAIFVVIRLRLMQAVAL
jgi:hypothetical protein